MISIAVVEPWRTITAAPLVLALPLGEVRLTCATGVGVPLAVELVPVEVAAVLEAGAGRGGAARAGGGGVLGPPPPARRTPVASTATAPPSLAPSTGISGSGPRDSVPSSEATTRAQARSLPDVASRL